jgi:hypothetical protein
MNQDAFEAGLGAAIFRGNAEKTYLDKLFSGEDADRIKELMKISPLDRSQLLELLYLLSGNEAKKLNYGEWERYIILKFFVWVREFTKQIERFFDYIENLKDKKEYVLNDTTLLLIKNNQRTLEHDAKFLVDVYLNIARTSLSLGATGFLEPLKNKYELEYTGRGLTGADTSKAKHWWQKGKKEDGG